MLIRDAEIEGGARVDVRIANGRVRSIGQLSPFAGEDVIDAEGGLLLPGLHDHHIHLAALAARRSSALCGPPETTTPEELASRLGAPGEGWLRGIGYHESVAGMLDAATLDQMAPHRPVRIQHRSGRMWFLNSAGLARLLERASPPPGLERTGGRFTGRLFDEDRWLTEALASRPPALADVGALLAAVGVTGVTDMTPQNDAAMAAHFAGEQTRGALPQKLLIAGAPTLVSADMVPGQTLGPVKFHLHEAQLPLLDDIIEAISDAHRSGRAIAVHCVTEVELVFTLAAIAHAGARPGDRIEHAGIAPDESLDEIRRLGLAVVSQPHFISERGDTYLADVEPRLRPFLYRLQSFRSAGVTLAAGSDAPFGEADPWASMAAAVSRRTASGLLATPAEALEPADALDLYLRDPEDLSVRRRVAVGVEADLCLIDRPWARACTDLGSVRVRGTIARGRLVHDAIDQTPVQRRSDADPTT